MKLDTDAMTEDGPDTENLKEIKERILGGIKWVKQGHYTGLETRWEQWKRNQKYKRCIWDDGWVGDLQIRAFNVNTVHANYHTKKPTLYFKNPKITAVPTKPEFTRDEMGNKLQDENGNPVLADNYQAAKLFSTKINYELREIGFKKALKAVVGDNLCPYGIGWIKWGYKQLTSGGHSNERSRSVSYWCQRVDPRNIVYDWMATSMEDCRWIAERIVKTRKECKALGFKIPENYRCSLPDFMKDRKDTANKGINDSEENLVVFWEYHDLVEDSVGWYLVADEKGGISSELKKPTDKPYPFEGSSYGPLVLDPDNEDIIGLSDVEPIEDQALAINRMRTMEVKHMDNFGTTVFKEESAITPDELLKYQRTPFGATVTVKDGMLGKIKVETTPALGNDHYRMSEIHKDEIRTTLGITDYQQGGSQSRTATEGNIIQNAANIRIEEQRDIIYDFVVDCVRKLAGMIQAFSDEEEYLNLKDEQIEEDYVDVLKRDYGFNPKIPFLKMKKKDIQGEFNFEFNIEDMISRPKEVQLQQLTNLISVVGTSPLMMQAAEEEDLDFGKVLKEAFDLSGIDINKMKRGGPAMLSVAQENQMFLSGMEVPEPHRKDEDDEHILGHMPVLQQIESQLQAITSQVQQITQQGQSIAAQAQGFDPADPKAQALGAQAQQLQAQGQEQVQQLSLQAQQLENLARNLRLHIQNHEQQRQKKDMGSRGGAGGAKGQGMPQGQPAASMQAQMQGQAQQVG